MSLKVIGLTGSSGSGCTTVGRHIEKIGYRYISLSDELHRLFPGARRHELQSEGNKLRQDKPGYLAQVVIDAIRNDSNQRRWVVDSIRNQAEVKALASSISEFYLFGVFADRSLRWGRVRDKPDYDGSESQFDADDRRDTRDDEPAYGQRVRDCYTMADVIIANNENWKMRNDEVEQVLEKTVGQ